MIRAEALLASLADSGFGLLAGVPCSYLTPLIDAAICDPGSTYLGAANEGDAVAAACGAWLGGVRGVAMFQNSGLGNAVNPLTSLTATFRIPILILTTWRGEPGGAADEPQHGLMGGVTPGLLELMEIPWERLPEQEDALGPALARGLAHMEQHGTPYAFIVPKGGVGGGPAQPAPRPPPAGAAAAPAPWRGREPLDPDRVLRAVQDGVTPDTAVVATTGYTGRALYAQSDRDGQLYMVGSMGCASSLGLGLAIAQPARRVVVLDGDGAMLMRMGAAACLGHERPGNLVHVLLDNGVHDSTGSQATNSDSTDLAAIAHACGYPRVLRAETPEALRDTLAAPEDLLTFLHVRTRPREDRKLPRPELSPPQIAARFRAWLAEPARASTS